MLAVLKSITMLDSLAKLIGGGGTPNGHVSI
jgi:hypothetical protein